MSVLLSGKQLAAELGRDRRYISYMKRAGFIMPGGLATVEEARAWLARNPSPRSWEKPKRQQSKSRNP